MHSSAGKHRSIVVDDVGCEGFQIGQCPLMPEVSSRRPAILGRKVPVGARAQDPFDWLFTTLQPPCTFLARSASKRDNQHARLAANAEMKRVTKVFDNLAGEFLGVAKHSDCRELACKLNIHICGLNPFHLTHPPWQLRSTSQGYMPESTLHIKVSLYYHGSLLRQSSIQARNSLQENDVSLLEKKPQGREGGGPLLQFMPALATFGAQDRSCEKP